MKIRHFTLARKKALAFLREICLDYADDTGTKEGHKTFSEPNNWPSLCRVRQLIFQSSVGHFPCRLNNMLLIWGSLLPINY